MLRFVLAFVLAIGVGSYAMAKDKGGKAPKSPEDIFKSIAGEGNDSFDLDKYKDSVKKHVKDETKQAKALEVAEKHFAAMDTNGDKKVTLDEFKAAAEKHGKKKAK